MKKIIFVILGLILIAGAIGAGYWYGKEKNQKISNITNNDTQEKCSSNQPNGLCLPGESTVSEDSSGLKTFRSERYGVEFNFSSSYQASVSHSFEEPDTIILASPNSTQYNQGSIRFSIKYNPTFADPIETVKQTLKDCQEQSQGVGVPCGAGMASLDKWQKIIIDDKSYGYRTGIGGDPMLEDSFYAISSIAGPKGSTFQFDAYLPSFDSSKGTEIPIEQLAAQDPNVQKFLADFGQIIKSIKFFSIFENQ